MASLRNWVTGSDACAPSDSMGGNNAASSFADALLGGRSKRQQRLHELPSVVGQEHPHAPHGQETPEDAATALAETPLPAIPGMPQVSAGHPSDFERAWAESSFDHTRPPVSTNVGVTAVLHSFLRPDGDNRLVGPPFLRSTMEMPEKVLSVPEGLRVRNRSTILARQVYADRGAMYADQKVEALLRALHIDASSLPHTLSDVDVESWNRIYDSKSVEYPHNQRFASENFLGHPSLINNNKESWVDEFVTNSQTGQDGGWANEYLAKEVEQGFDAQPIEVGTQEHSRKLANTLNKDPKFQNSKFLQFVSKMSNGELIVEGNAVKEVSKTAAAWVEEFSNANSNSTSKPSMWGDEFASFQAQQHPAAWVDEFATDFSNTQGGADWGNEYLEQLELLRNLGGGDVREFRHEYVFAENNPFLLDMESMEKGKDLFQRGVLTEAVLAFEAACQQNPGSAEAWRLLGTVHAENDDDVKAIIELNRSLAIAPDDLNTLLSLGVSHTNELEREPAVRYLKQWLLSHPTHGPLLQSGPLETLETSADSSQSLHSVVCLFETAASQSPSEPEVYSALGVLYTLSRRFSDAVTAFEAALEIRGSVDYSLWNKLGATLANSGRSAEALTAYQRALDLKPNYMRAWTNMGIALANLGEYENSARYYVRALALNRSAPSVWGYLRNSLSCAGRDDLMRAADEEDLDALLIELPL
jgi:peroxin-5